MGSLEQYVEVLTSLTTEAQTKILERMLQKFSSYPLARFKLREVWLLNDVRQQHAATPEQWTDLVALALNFYQGDQELVELLRRHD